MFRCYRNTYKLFLDIDYMEKCVSCDKASSDGVRFPCPKCGSEIFRCKKCRSLSLEYKCPICGFVGP